MVRHYILVAFPFYDCDEQVKEIKLIKDIGMSTDTPTLSEKVPAELALIFHSWKVVTYLLKRGVRIKGSHRKGNSFFHELAKCNLTDNVVTETTRHLVSCGLDINLRNSDGDTPVHVAADEGHWQMVEIFVANGADVNAHDRNGCHLVHKFVGAYDWVDIDCYEGVCDSHFELPKTLVKYGVDVNIRDPDDNTALQIAIDKTHWHTVGWLVQTGAVCELSQEEKELAFTNLHYFLWEDVDEEKLKLFIKHITNDLSDINRSFPGKDRYNIPQTVLEMCTRSGNWKMMKALVELGAKVTRESGQLLQLMTSRYTSSDHASWLSFLDVLVLRGLDINDFPPHGPIALFCRESIRSLLSGEQVENTLFYALLERASDRLLEDTGRYRLLTRPASLSRQRVRNALSKLLQNDMVSCKPKLQEVVLKLLEPRGKSSKKRKEKFQRS